MGGYDSSVGFRDTRVLLGEPKGLAGRNTGGYIIRPEPSTPGIDRVRPMGGGARLATDLDRLWPPERGEVVRGRYGRDIVGVHEGELGEGGSVDRRKVVGLRSESRSLVLIAVGWCRRSVGRGEDRNSSIRSVSGTGSISSEDNGLKEFCWFGVHRGRCSTRDGGGTTV